MDGRHITSCAVVHFSGAKYKFYFKGTKATNCGDDVSHGINLKNIEKNK
jgi:hypothetical protein